MRKETKEVSATSIIHEAANLFFYNGYKNTSLQEVANRLNVTRPAIYHYFKSKEHIILAINEEVISKTNQYLSDIMLLDGPSDLKFIKMVENHILLILNNQIKFGIFFEEQKFLPLDVTNKTKQVVDDYYKIATDWFAEGVANGHFIEVNPSIAVQTILGSCNWAYKWYSSDGVLAKDEISKVMSEILMKGYKK